MNFCVTRVSLHFFRYMFIVASYNFAEKSIKELTSVERMIVLQEIEAFFNRYATYDFSGRLWMVLCLLDSMIKAEEESITDNSFIKNPQMLKQISFLRQIVLQ